MAIASLSLALNFADPPSSPRAQVATGDPPLGVPAATVQPAQFDPPDAAAPLESMARAVAPPIRKGYRFAATLTARNAMIFRGMAPDTNTRTKLLRTISTLAPSPDTRGTITLNPAMSDGHWSELVEQALGTLVLMRTGTLAIRDWSVTLDGVVDDERDLRRLMIRVRPDWAVNVEAPTPASLTTLAIEITRDGPAMARGRLPPGLAVEEMRAALPEVRIDDGAVGSRLNGEAEGWANALAAIATALPRLAEGSILVGDGLIDMRGRLRRGFSRQSTHAALRSMTPAGWRLSYDVQETAPPSQATLELTTDGVYLRGMLPAGTDLPELRSAVGADQLNFGGDGDPVRWATAVSAAARLLGLMSDGRVRLEAGDLEAAGRLLPGQTLDEIEDWLNGATGGYWEIDLSEVAVTQPTEGTIRTNPKTGVRQQLRGGQWATIAIGSSPSSDCIDLAKSIESERAIRFLAGSRRVAPSAADALDRLAALADRCLSFSPSARLEIGGHTDAVGSAAQNQALSEARAGVVRAALIERGAPAARLIARGYGESRPIADNETESGRARNRRISLRWQNLGKHQGPGRAEATAETAQAN